MLIGREDRKMKFLRSIEGSWINIDSITVMWVSRENVIIAKRKVDDDLKEMSKKFESYEKAQEDLDAWMDIVNRSK